MVSNIVMLVSFLATDISDIEKRFQKLPLKDDATDEESIGDDDMSERLSVLQPWGRNRNVLPSCMFISLEAKILMCQYIVAPMQ